MTVAHELLGKYLIRSLPAGSGLRRPGPPATGDLLVGRIVEVEAYLGPRDLAAHTARGRTARNETMWGPAGRLYVYMIYGMHSCMNVVTEGGGAGTAVLLRALEPVCHIEGRTNGPGLLCRALEIDRRMDGADLLGDDIWIAAAGEEPRVPIVRRPRIGVDYAGHWARRLLRFYLRGSRHVSRP